VAAADADGNEGPRSLVLSPSLEANASGGSSSTSLPDADDAGTLTCFVDNLTNLLVSESAASSRPSGCS
jgi:hypothetical protein